MTHNFCKKFYVTACPAGQFHIKCALQRNFYLRNRHRNKAYLSPWRTIWCQVFSIIKFLRITTSRHLYLISECFSIRINCTIKKNINQYITCSTIHVCLVMKYPIGNTHFTHIFVSLVNTAITSNPSTTYGTKVRWRNSQSKYAARMGPITRFVLIKVSLNWKLFHSNFTQIHSEHILWRDLDHKDFTLWDS